MNVLLGNLVYSFCAFIAVIFMASAVVVALAGFGRQQNEIADILMAAETRALKRAADALCWGWM